LSWGREFFFLGGAIQGRREQGEEEPAREMCEKERKKGKRAVWNENENVANFFFFQKSMDETKP
jgi:hypothetical protein